MDRLGYAIGLFGLCTSPMAVLQYYGQDGETMIPLVALFIGIVSFMFFISEASQQADDRS